MNTAPQWFPDPDSPTRLRYWDGTAWTDEYKPVTQSAGGVQLFASLKPSPVFIGASWLVMAFAAIAFTLVLYDLATETTVKGFYAMVVLFAMFGVVALSKSVRDKVEGIPVSPAFYGLSFAAVAIPAVALILMLIFSDFAIATRWLIFICAVLLVYATAAVQKNIRDLAAFNALAAIAPPQRQQQDTN